jgi:Zn-finger nucleic acid-binding protein
MRLDRWDCPRCHRALEDRTLASLPLHVCTTCGGIAFEPHSERLLREPAHRAELAALATQLDAQATARFDGNAVTYLHCPRCSGPLARQNFERASGFIIDRCIRHGAWFDRTEVLRGIAFLAGGGLEKKKVIEEREAEYLYEQKQQIRRIEQHTQNFRGHYPADADPISRWMHGLDDFPLRPPRRGR